MSRSGWSLIGINDIRVTASVGCSVHKYISEQDGGLLIESVQYSLKYEEHEVGLTGCD